MMNGVQVVPISDAEVNKLLAIEEGHFADLKAIETLPAGLTRAIAALSNAEGGEVLPIRRPLTHTSKFSSSCSR